MDKIWELRNEFNKVCTKINNEFYKQRNTLKPCPFCGDTPTIDICQQEDTDGWAFWAPSIRCSNCGYSMKDIRNQYESSIEARLCSPYLIAKWNTRVKLKEEE